MKLGELINDCTTTTRLLIFFPSYCKRIDCTSNVLTCSELACRVEEIEQISSNTIKVKCVKGA